MTRRSIRGYAWAPSVLLAAAFWPTVTFAAAAVATPSPKVVLISLDGAKSQVVDALTTAYPTSVLATLRSKGTFANYNLVANPSLTAVSHISIATGSTSIHNDIPANTFKAVVGALNTSISGFAAPIGGYDDVAPIGPSASPTAEPMWVQLRNAGKKVVAATWPGADGADILINGTSVQGPNPTRTVDYTVPFGAFGGLSAQGFSLSGGAFSSDPAVAAQLLAAGKVSFSPIQVTTNPVETVYCSPTSSSTCGTTNAFGRTTPYAIKVAALDSTDDGVTNYDTLVFFDANQGIQPGPFSLPSTGPAYVKVGGDSAKFFFEGSFFKVGAAFYATSVAPDLSTVRFARYGSNYIPRNAAVLADVDDINNNVGFWAPQPDFRIPERISLGFTSFPDTELEAIYEDMVKTWTRYQTAVAYRAITQNKDADLVMVYFEQPDGSSHQFWINDPRQATNPTDATSIGSPGSPAGASGQDQAKIARYKQYLKNAYQAADAGVQQILKTVGQGADGTPKSNVFVVSDHGFAPFHTAVTLRNLLINAGVDVNNLAIRTSGPAANIYVNLQGRESGGTIGADEYKTLVTQVAAALGNAQDPNANFNYSLAGGKVFTQVSSRPLDCTEGTGFCTSEEIGQDFGDVFAVLDLGYNFDGLQTPGVARLGDAPFNATSTVFSVPNFYGAHGYDPTRKAMSATFIAAGPQIESGFVVDQVHNIDVAPTIMRILGVAPAATVDGQVLTNILK